MADLLLMMAEFFKTGLFAVGGGLATIPFLQEMAGRYGVSVAQLCIRYAIQRGVVPLPKSSAMERMKQNQDVFGFEIEEEDMYRLGTMPQTGWSGQHPDTGSIRGSER